MNNDLERFITKKYEFPSMPSIAMKVIELVSDPNTTVEVLSKAISVDEALSGRVLRLANSCYYIQYKKAVNPIAQIILVIGFNNLKNIILAASLKTIYKKFDFIEKRLHHHSIGTAIIAHHLAKEIGFDRKEEIFIAGLLHDIGKIVINNNMPEIFCSIMNEMDEEIYLPVKRETSLFNITHPQLGSYVVKHWGLSEELQEVIHFHHEPEKVDKKNTYIFQLTAIINLSDAICHKMGIGLNMSEDIDLTSLQSFLVLGLSDGRLQRIIEKVEESYLNEMNWFD